MSASTLSRLTPGVVTDDAGMVRLTRIVMVVRVALFGALAVLGGAIVAGVVAGAVLSAGVTTLALAVFLALVGAAVAGTLTFAAGDVLTE
jgi:hypothetical protein